MAVKVSNIFTPILLKTRQVTSLLKLLLSEKLVRMHACVCVSTPQYTKCMPNRIYTTVCIWSPIKWSVHYHNSLHIISPMNSTSLTAERCLSSFTYLCTLANLLKREQMVIIISINSIFSHTVAMEFCWAIILWNYATAKLFKVNMQE